MTISKQTLRWAALLPLVSILAACGGGGAMPLHACTFLDPGSQGAPAPSWICDERLEGSPKISAVGSFKMGSNVSLAKTAATTDATAQIARVIRVAVKELVRVTASSIDGQESSSIDRAVSTYTEEKLTGLRPITQRVSPGGVYYVLVGLDPRSAVEVLNGAIEAVNKSNDAVNLQKQAHEEGMKRLEEAAEQARSGS